MDIDKIDRVAEIKNRLNLLNAERLSLENSRSRIEVNAAVFNTAGSQTWLRGRALHEERTRYAKRYKLLNEAYVKSYEALVIQEIEDLKKEVEKI